jgi:cytochrome b involved in lipid metabolism
MNSFKIGICSIAMSLLAPPGVAAPSKELSPEEVARHATRTDCWIIVENNVYDITSAMKDHDRYKYKLDSWCGKEATEGWNTKDGKNKPHSRKAKTMLEGLHIGTVKRS